MPPREDQSLLLESQPFSFTKYDFIGHHLIASYSQCNSAALRNITGLVAVMKEAIKVSGATLLHSLEHVFPNGGFTMVLLLAESHASIHTYPEWNACFVDFFTCGNSCVVEKSDSVLREYLQPRQASCQVLLRNEATIGPSHLLDGPRTS